MHFQDSYEAQKVQVLDQSVKWKNGVDWISGE